MSKIKEFLDNSVWTILTKSKNKDSLSAYYILDEVRTNKAVLYSDQEFQDLKDILKDKDKPKDKNLQYYIYLASNFFKPLFTFKYKDYKTNEVINGVIRWVNRTEAIDNAKLVYWLTESPEKVQEVIVSPDRLVDQFKVYPTHFLRKKIPTWPLWEFLVEYASLREDGFDQAQAISVLKDSIKDKGVLHFANELKSSNLHMSALMSKLGIFDDYTVSIVRSAEMTWWDSKFYEGISRLGQNYIKQAAFRKKFISSMYYPAFLITLVIIITLVAIIKIVPMIVWLFIELAWEEKLPGYMKSLLAFNQEFGPFMIKVWLITAFIWTIKKILLNNSILLWLWTKMKLKLPLYGPIIQKVEENRLVTILLQTELSNLTEMQKIQALEKATPNVLYKWLYRTMAKKYARERDFTRTLEGANNTFNWVLFGKRLLITLNLLKISTTDKKIQKYESFLDKNTAVLYQYLGKVNTLITTLTIALIWWLVAWLFWTILSFVISLIQNI